MSVLSNGGHVYESDYQNSQLHSADNRICHQRGGSPFIRSRSLVIGTSGSKARWIRGNNSDPPYSYKQVCGLCHVRGVYLSIARGLSAGLSRLQCLRTLGSDQIELGNRLFLANDFPLIKNEAGGFYQRPLFAALDCLIGFDVGFWRASGLCHVRRFYLSLGRGAFTPHVYISMP